MASSERRVRVLDALGRLLDPVVLLLLKSGITFREFSDLARTKFVQVATREFGIRGRPTNASRVAILTGLDRREVRKVRLAEQVPGVSESGYMSKPTQVLDGSSHVPPSSALTASRLNWQSTTASPPSRRWCDVTALAYRRSR